MLKKNWQYFFYAVLLFPFSVKAATSGIVPCGVSASGVPNCTLGNLLDMLKTIYKMLLGFSAIVAVLFIIIGGIRMLYWSFMEESESELKSARYTVTRAITGLIIVAAAYFIVNTFIGFLGGGDFNTIFSKGLGSVH